MEAEFEILEKGFTQAQSLNLESKTSWQDDLIQKGLALGRAYLSLNANEDMSEGLLIKAFEIYEKLLLLKSDKIPHKSILSQDLHVYSNRHRDRENWNLALQALQNLQKFNLLAPDKHTQPDPRTDGAIQHLILTQVKIMYLEQFRSKPAFELLATMPRPKPTGAIKDLIHDYSQSWQSENKMGRGHYSLKKLKSIFTNVASGTSSSPNRRAEK